MWTEKAPSGNTGPRVLPQAVIVPPIWLTLTPSAAESDSQSRRGLWWLLGFELIGLLVTAGLYVV